MHYRAGKLYLCTWNREIDYVRHHDYFLCPLILCMENPLSNQQSKNHNGTCILVSILAHPFMPFPAKRMGKRHTPVKLGHLPEYSICLTRPAHHHSFLSAGKSAERQRIPLDVADHRFELWILYPGRTLGRLHPTYRHVDDSQNMRLCLDCFHRLPGNGT